MKQRFHLILTPNKTVLNLIAKGLVAANQLKRLMGRIQQSAVLLILIKVNFNINSTKRVAIITIN